MKQFQTPEGVQIYLNLFTLEHNFRVFPRGKRKEYSPVQFEGLNVSLNYWSDLLYADKAIPEEALFLSGRLKDAIFLKSVQYHYSQGIRPFDKKCAKNEARSLARKGQR